ncbi:osteocalcin isoform X1 [Octodon degus]|uniref:Osteocalcin n=1 Tax=Octodon degus TaxID=10160 RepID=A0A6P6EB75_OCTDE|nr:osteocalcin isoform X1 [Octodon degus]
MKALTLLTLLALAVLCLAAWTGKCPLLSRAWPWALLTLPSSNLTAFLRLSPFVPRSTHGGRGRGMSRVNWLPFSADAKHSGAESGKRAAFLSKQEGSEVVKRLRRYLDQPGVGAPAPAPDPLEPQREVCELNPDCDELADHIGFQDAYQRFYGRV